MNDVNAKYLKAYPGRPTSRAKGHKLTGGVQPGDEALTWYVVRAATRQEDRAEENLIDQGFVVYVPRMTRWVRGGRTKRRVAQSLFGGYMFVGLNDGQTPGDLPDIDGVHAVVRFSTERDPVSVPFRPVSAILGAEMGGLFDRTVVVARPQPRPGDVVQITGGKFTGFAAQVVRLEKDKRIRLLFEIFGRASEMTEKLANVALLS